MEVWSNALEELAKHPGVGRDKRVGRIVDRAGFHTGRSVRIPEGIDVIQSTGFEMTG